MEYEVIDHQNQIKILCYTVRSWNHMVHFHQEHEILYVLRGQINALWNQQAHLLRERDLFVVEGNELHDIFSADPTNALLVLQFHPDFFSDFCPAIAQLRLRKHQLSAADGDVYFALRHCLSNIVEQCQSQSPAHFFQLIHSICEILVQLLESLQIESSADARPSKVDDMNLRLLRILEFISENYSRHLTLREISDREGLNFYYLSHFMHERLGMTFQEYLTKLRVRNAEFMLSYGRTSLTTVSRACGFSDPRYLKRAFQTEYGCDPEKFINNRNLPSEMRSVFLSADRNSCAPIDLESILHALTQPIAREEENPR